MLKEAATEILEPIYLIQTLVKGKWIGLSHPIDDKKAAFHFYNLSLEIGEETRILSLMPTIIETTQQP